MENLEYELMKMHLETIRREADTRLAIKRAGLSVSSLSERVLPFFGEMLIQLGTRLKERAYTRLTTEEASAPSFLIML